MFSSGDCPCSANITFPPGLITLFISDKAEIGSVTEQSVHVITTVSNVLESRGMSSAEAFNISVGNFGSPEFS